VEPLNSLQNSYLQGVGQLVASNDFARSCTYAPDWLPQWEGLGQFAAEVPDLPSGFVDIMARQNGYSSVTANGSPDPILFRGPSGLVGNKRSMVALSTAAWSQPTLRLKVKTTLSSKVRMPTTEHDRKVHK
jgi:hypothetical protein